jgi:hypothetical protein
MKIVLTCGHPESGFELVHEALLAAGLASARPSRQESLSPRDFHEKLLASHDLDAGMPATVGQLSPGKVWQELAVDLFLANMSAGPWGWADARTLCALEFWLAFDAQTRFVLVYASPEEVVARAMRDEAATRNAIDRIVESWTACNSEMLRFYNRHGGRCMLVNATGVARSPGDFVRRAGETFAMNLSPREGRSRSEAAFGSALASSLARALTEGCDEANALYRELESSADIDGSTGAALEEEALLAWREHAGLVSALHAAKTASVEERDLVSELRTEVESVRSRLMASEAAMDALATAQSEVARLRAQNTELTRDGDLLLLQVNQMREDLEHSDHLIRDLTQRTQEPAPQPHPHLSEIGVDMRGEIDGDNWYYAEHDGRWAGPYDTSTIRVPALREGNYHLSLDVVDAKARDILEGMKVALNGMSLTLRHEGEGVVALVHSRFSTNGMPKDREWEFRFKFPRLISPAEEGSDDTRLLAIRLRSMKLSRVE